MSKEFDVHFLATFSDFVGSIEADSKEEAKTKAIDILHNKDHLIELFSNYINDLDFDLKVTDILEVG